MKVALALGRRGMGQCWPNPAVGCVIVKDNRVVARGWTQPGGRPHAEVHALARVAGAAKGATAYVSLEPCAHQGQTPPCALALAEAGVARVVTALADPDPRVDGGGHALLRGAGIEVSTGVCASEAARDHLGFLKRVTTGRPMLTLKLAMSLDGRIATSSGESQWITGPEARRFGHLLRAQHDAVMVGAGTVRADDPTLTVRDLGVSRQPVRVVISRALDLPVPSKLTDTYDVAPLWLVHAAQAPPENTKPFQQSEARLFAIPGSLDAPLDMAEALSALGAAGLTRVYCEGGGALAASVLKAGLVDEIALFTAGKAIGAEGIAGLGKMALTDLGAAPRFDLVDRRQLGGDLFSRWVRADQRQIPR